MLIGTPPWKFRWVFVYANKAEKTGCWNQHHVGDPARDAMMQSREGLVEVRINAKDRDKEKEVTLAGCSGQDFCGLQWIGTARTQGFVHGTHTAETIITGIKLISRYAELSIFSNGKVQSGPREYEDNLYHFGRLDNA
jgi:hypothetical protein